MPKKPMLTYKAIGWLLTYPQADLIAALPELQQVIAGEGLLSVSTENNLLRFTAALGTGDLIDLQEAYVGLFDKSRQASLHLFEHVHGESRDRGMAMVNLREIYAAAGLFQDEGELPDYLPMYLEYLSILPDKEAKAGLVDVAPILQGIHRQLARRESAYAAPLAALLELAAVKPLAVEAEETEARDDTPEAIDRAWEEQAVAFGPENDPTRGDDCGRASAMVARMNAQSATPSRTEARHD
ncbi:nitrate reductase molybdenum cofactor assembly chaperone [Dongia sp.]|uniref:nitrate reductase molybdenum cofactor assembly chaperone n=1 Tax=Dongia sp. TaxID=1977262 RepID=UPI0035B1BF9F